MVEKEEEEDERLELTQIGTNNQSQQHPPTSTSTTTITTTTTTTKTTTTVTTTVTTETSNSTSTSIQRAVRLPTYIDSSLLRYYSLSTQARLSAEQILWQLSESYPQITFAPILYPLVAIFLHKHDHDHTYHLVCQLLQKNQQATRDRQFKQMLMPTTRLEHIRDIIILIKLCTKFGILAPFWMLDLVREEKKFLADLNSDTLRSASNLQTKHQKTQSLQQQTNWNSCNSSSHNNNNSNSNNINNNNSTSNNNNNDTNNKDSIGTENNNNNPNCTDANSYQNFDTPFLDWYKWIFVALPYAYCSRILDHWLVDGQKFLYRIVLAMLCRFRKHRNNGVSFNTNTMFDFCSKLESTLEPKGGVEQLIKEAKSLKRIPTKKIARASRKAETKASLIVELLMRRPHSGKQSQRITHLKQPRDDMITNVIISSRIAPRNLNSSIINDQNLLDDLWQYLPESAAVKTASMVFNSNNDGTSLQTFFSRVDPYEETIIIIRTIKNEVFGSYCSSSWSLRNKQTQSALTKSYYFGNGETFLFTLKPKFSVYLWVGKTDSDTKQHLDFSNQTDYNHLHVHRDSVTDSISTQLFMSATSQELIIGSGNGSFGLWLDAELTRGKTDHCKTFNNSPLCADKDFTCKDVEVVAFA